MASSRKKLDEKNVKILRELASLQHNKYCFDCNQRGPTYVNVTIGSFVCTKCSGILRGLTPPHRVKSISMATFTQEEVELIKNRGNNHCRSTWLGLYEGNMVSECRDEQVVRDFMVEKYEKKRYYLEPSATLTNGIDSHTPSQVINKSSEIKSTNNIIINQKVSQIKAIPIEKRNANKKISDFVADFGSADIYNALNANKDNNVNNNVIQQSFANFDNNAIFNSNINSTSNKLEELGLINFDPIFDQTLLFPKCNLNNHWSASNVSSNNQQFNVTPSQAPPEDRYAALKDLDNALKVQPQIDWNSGSSSSFSSATPTSSVYSSPSPHGSMYGSPSQNQLANVFSQEQPKTSNPFNGSIIWNDNVNQQQVGSSANPFRSNTNNKVNGSLNNFYTTPAFPTNNSSPWMPNPFYDGLVCFEW